jgi:6-phosphogluconate dehydrogenase
VKIVVVGLGKMGAQIAERFLEHGHQVVAIDPNPEAVSQITAQGASGAVDRADAAAQFNGEQVVVWLMIPAGLVTQELTAWLEVLPEGSIVIDGGNSDFRNTIKHYEQAQAKQVELVDVGTSGGILGVKNGFSMMVGGSRTAYEHIEPLLQALSNPSGGYRYFGDSGAGHYVKMVHNAIEYGLMESLAEGYRMLKEGPYDNLSLADAGAVWQEASIIKSDLNQLAAEAMAENPNLDGIDGYVAESGEARWTLEVAEAKNIKLEAIQAALDVRINSQNGQTDFRTKMLAELRNKFGGHHLNKD